MLTSSKTHLTYLEVHHSQAIGNSLTGSVQRQGEGCTGTLLCSEACLSPICFLVTFSFKEWMFFFSTLNCQSPSNHLSLAGLGSSFSFPLLPAVKDPEELMCHTERQQSCDSGIQKTSPRKEDGRNTSREKTKLETANWWQVWEHFPYFSKSCANCLQSLF